ncbi:MAG: hypothetical protein BGO49_10610 [Planctomycetales bacterium 71-10]|nr:MAG: hypothetical protein BGO49_10610 [Planctomycetales bacterium 71-10]
MARSARLRLQDLRSIHRLVGECRELGDSAAAWRSHLLDEASRWLGAGVGIDYDARWDMDLPIDAIRVGGVTDRGWEGGFDRSAWDAVHVEFVTRGSDYQPMIVPYFEALRRGYGPALTRADLISGRDWYGSDYYRNYHRSMGGDAMMYCILPMNRKGLINAFFLVRPAREPDFTPRARTIVAELHSQIVSQIEGPLAGYHEPSPDDLAPRARQVLRCLLEGDGDKQIAARLELSRHTVNFYVRRIFAHFGVESRSELMARWIRRGWGLSSMPLDEGD